MLCGYSLLLNFTVPHSKWCAYQILTVFPHTMCELHSAVQQVVCTSDTDSVPTHNLWVTQCRTACDVHLQIPTVFPHTVCELHSAVQHVMCTYRYWQCSHSQYVSFIVPNSMWCAPTDTDSVPTHTVCEFLSAPQHVVCTYIYWQCSHTQYVSFTVPHSMWCAH